MAVFRSCEESGVIEITVSLTRPALRTLISSIYGTSRLREVVEEERAGHAIASEVLDVYEFLRELAESE